MRKISLFVMAAIAAAMFASGCATMCKMCPLKCGQKGNSAATSADVCAACGMPKAECKCAE